MKIVKTIVIFVKYIHVLYLLQFIRVKSLHVVETRKKFKPNLKCIIKQYLCVE